MFVRIATFEGGDTERLRQLTEERRQSGEMTLPEGVSRIMLLAGDRRLFLAFSESREGWRAQRSSSTQWATRSQKNCVADAHPSTSTRS